MKRMVFKSPVITSIVLGVAAGMLCHLAPENGTGQAVAAALTAVSDVFLRLVRVLIAPLVLGTVVAGIGGVDNVRAVRRLGLKAAAWFIGASAVSLSLAFGIIALMPGALFQLRGVVPLPAAELPSIAPTMQTFLTHIVPRSLFEALAQNEMLQVATFAVLFGIALSTVKDVLGGRLVEVVEEFVIIMLQLTNLIMRLAPVAAFCATAAFTAKQGLGVIATYGAFVGGVLAGLAALSAVTCLAAYLVLRGRTGQLLRQLREPVALGFATASSEAAFPRLMEQLDGYGVSHKLTGMVLPLGYSFNLCGSMYYQAFAALFLARAYDIPLGIAVQLDVLFLVLIFSKGIAGVPRASLVVLAAVLPQIGVPREAVLLLLGIDQVVDMCRTAMNVLGNGIATAVIARWEQRRPTAVSLVPLAGTPVGQGAVR